MHARSITAKKTAMDTIWIFERPSVVSNLFLFCWGFRDFSRSNNEIKTDIDHGLVRSFGIDQVATIDRLLYI